jgi:hypothetical protein
MNVFKSDANAAVLDGRPTGLPADCGQPPTAQRNTTGGVPRHSHTNRLSTAQFNWRAEYRKSSEPYTRYFPPDSAFENAVTALIDRDLDLLGKCLAV